MFIQVMQELGLIGLRIQRMPSEPNCEFGIPSQYSYMTVCFSVCNNILLSSFVQKIYSIMFIFLKQDLHYFILKLQLAV
jgi:hypothetical protein